MPVADVVAEISKCEAVLSSSLHGLVVADSFGIPNRRAVASDLLTGGDYKFRDYYSAFGISPASFDLRTTRFGDNDIADIHANYKIQIGDVEQKQKALIEAFPKEFL